MVQQLHIPKLKIDVSKTVLHYNPDSAPESFTITVINQSGEFTSFKLDLIAAGTLPQDEHRWYRLTPSVSYKIPPGDRTQFQVEIIDVPPIQGGAIDTTNVVVRVDALELGLQERRDVRLVVEGTPVRPLELTVQPPVIEARPGDRFDLAIEVINRNPKPADAALALDDVSPSWFPHGLLQSFTVPAQASMRIEFFGQLPGTLDTPSGNYFITVNGGRSPTPITSNQVTVKVLPMGHGEVYHTPDHQQVPHHRGMWLNPRQAETEFHLNIHNQSNCSLTATAELVDPDIKPPRPQKTRRRGWFQRWRKKKSSTPPPPRSASQKSADESDDESQSSLNAARKHSSDSQRTLTLSPKSVAIQPGDTADLTVNVTQRLPWLGWKRIKMIEAHPSVDVPEIQLYARPNPSDKLDAADNLTEESGHMPSTPETWPDELTESGVPQLLELHILPIIPFWLQGLSALLLMVAIAAGLLVNRGHTKPVNTVQISGRANEVISAADDATLRRWVIRGNRLRSAGVLERGDKAIRVIRYRPVNNDQIVAGLENGTVLMHDFLSQYTKSFGYQRDDRVFDIAFTPDSRRFFSAHGSGLILEWQADGVSDEPLQGIEVDFAIEAIGIVGDRQQYLAIGGRYNQLTLFDQTEGIFYDLNYLTGGGQNDYITSIATATGQPTRFTTADNQGRIALWDLETCAVSPSQCRPIDEWLGHSGTAVHDLALSADSCYLASAGADGRAIVWPLDSQGGRYLPQQDGKVLQRSDQPLNAIALIQDRNRLLVVSGGDDTNVQLTSVRLQRERLPGGICQGV